MSLDFDNSLPQGAPMKRRGRPPLHGMTHAPEYRIWSGIVTRTTNSQSEAWGNYGGRGICICTRWRTSFVAFYADMGPRPTPKHSIDRINNEGMYSCGQCRESATRIAADFNIKFQTVYKIVHRLEGSYANKIQPRGSSCVPARTR